MRNSMRISKYSFLYKTVVIILTLLLSISCAWRKDFRQGQNAFEKKDWDQAVTYFLKAVNEKPGNVELRMSLVNALISASNHYLQIGKQFLEAGEYKSAMVAFEKSLDYNPENNIARTKKHHLLKKLKEFEKQQLEKTEIQKLKEDAAAAQIPEPQLDYKDKPYSLTFSRVDIEQIFKALQKSSGVRFIYDDTFKSKKITLNLKKVDFMEALDIIMLQSNMFYKIFDSRTVIIIPDTAGKRKAYEELVMKTVFIDNADAEEISKTVKAFSGLKIISTDKNTNAIIFKGLPQEVKLAERIARTLDKSKGEVFIDIEIIEVNRSRAQEYGIELSQYQVTQTYWPETGSGTEPTSSTIRLHRLGHTDASDYLLTHPSVIYKLLRTDRDSHLKARPQLRTIDGHKTELHLGDKVPIPTTSFVPYNVSGLAQQPITSYQLQDIGINISLTPHIHYDGQVTLEMEFELTFITSPGTESLPPTIGNRTVKTLIKLRDNETSVLAGLLRDVERQSLTGFPFLSQVPILKDLFSGNSKEVEQTDIILTLTPRIIRFPEINEEDLELLWVGTQDKPGLKEPPPELIIKDEEEEELKNNQPKTSKTTNKDKNNKKTKEEKDKKKSETANTKTESTENTTQPQSQPIQLLVSEPQPNLKKDVEANISLGLSGDGEIKAITLEMDFNPTKVQVLDVHKGELLTHATVKSLLLRNIDNQQGKIKVNISLVEQPLKIKGDLNGQLVVFRVKPLEKGKITFNPSIFRVLNAGMKKIKDETAGKPIELNVTD